VIKNLSLAVRGLETIYTALTDVIAG